MVLRAFCMIKVQTIAQLSHSCASNNRLFRTRITVFMLFLDKRTAGTEKDWEVVWIILRVWMVWVLIERYICGRDCIHLHALLCFKEEEKNSLFEKKNLFWTGKNVRNTFKIQLWSLLIPMVTDSVQAIYISVSGVNMQCTEGVRKWALFFLRGEQYFFLQVMA